MEKKMIIDSTEVLATIASTFFSVHVIDLVDDTFTEYKSHAGINGYMNGFTNAADTMRHIMENRVTDNFKEQILEFSNLRTIGQRLKGKKALSEEFLGKSIGWVKETFITMETDADGTPTKVIHTIEGIGEQKEREEILLRMSHRDALTGCLNRLAYNEKITCLKKKPLENTVYMSFDLNCLKILNDRYGHDAGDELIMGAAECLLECLGKYGKIYRNGGDEFVSIIPATPEEFTSIKSNLTHKISNWHGKSVDELYISIGYAPSWEFPGVNILELAKISDERMYKDKNEFYKRKGIDRRGQQVAYNAVCASYDKILKLNLTYDTHTVIRMNAAERSSFAGYSSKTIEWLEGFAYFGIHKEDQEKFLSKANGDFLKAHFAAGNEKLQLTYRRNFGGVYKKASIEFIRAEDYRDDNQSVYVFVKEIDFE